jgi:hypothetical protein
MPVPTPPMKSLRLVPWLKASQMQMLNALCRKKMFCAGFKPCSRNNPILLEHVKAAG